MKSLAVLSATVVVGLGCAAMSCSSSSTPGGTSSGGATSALGGSTSSSGGASSHSGGSTSASGGSTAGGGCTKSNTDKAPSGDLLGGFADDAGTGDAGLAIKGGISTFGNARGSIADGDTLVITQNASASTSTQFSGAVLYFNNCVDAVQFSGVEFAISGTVSGCTVQFSANYSGTTAAVNDKKGTCPGTATTCVAPQKSITVSPSATQLRIQWEDLGTAGSPPGPVDESQLTGLQWQFTAASGSACSASLTISNLKFF